MTPTRILPDLQFSVVCEDIRREVGGTCSLIGVVAAIPVPQVPVSLFKLFVFNRWTAGVGQFTETVRFMAPDGTTVLRKGDVRFALQDPVHSATNVTFLGQIQLPATGVYHIEVSVDDVMKIRYPLPVLLVKPPNGAEAPPPTTEPGTSTQG
jgi:hypothetical protein